MKRPGFFEGVAVAAIASLAGGACYVALTTLFSSTAVLRFVVAGLALAYITYLLSRNEERVGRITVIALWLPAACVLWFIEPSFFRGRLYYTPIAFSAPATIATPQAAIEPKSSMLTNFCAG